MASDDEALAHHRRNQAVLSVYAQRDRLQVEVERLQEERDMLLVERASLSDEGERLRGLLAEAVHYLESCGCDDDECPGRQKAAQLRAALSPPAGGDSDE